MKAKNLFLAFSGLNKLRNVAATPNAISSPSGETYIHAGQSIEITWEEPSGRTVDLILMQGNPNQLEKVSMVGIDVPNQGSAAWTVPSNLSPGKYALQIVSDNALTNYSPFFTVLDPVSPKDFGVGTNKVVRSGSDRGSRSRRGRARQLA